MDLNHKRAKNCHFENLVLPDKYVPLLIGEEVNFDLITTKNKIQMQDVFSKLID